MIEILNIKKANVLWFISVFLLIFINGFSSSIDGYYSKYFESNEIDIFVEPVLESKYSVNDVQADAPKRPSINIELLNKGNGALDIERIDYEIVYASLNMTPVLSLGFFNDEHESNNIIMARIENIGWGPAKDLEWISNIDLGRYTSYLRIPNNQLKWKGYVNPGEELTLNFIYRPQAEYYASLFLNNHDELISNGHINTEIGFKDINQNIKPAIYLNNTLYLYRINPKRETQGIFNVYSCNASSQAQSIFLIDCNSIPETIFYIDSINPEIYPVTYHFDYNNRLKKNELENIIIRINSTQKSGNFLQRIKLYYNSGKSVTSRLIELELIKKNEICYKNKNCNNRIENIKS